MTDEQARRELADQVKATIVRNGVLRADEIATAASAVILASDLRAPALSEIDADAWYPTSAGRGKAR